MIYKPTDKKLVEDYPELLSYEEFNLPEEVQLKDELMKFVMYSVDPDSPYGKITDLDTRFRAAAKAAGLPDTDFTNDIIMGKSEYVNNMTTRFIIILDDDLFNMWFSMKKNFHAINHILRTPPSNEDSKKLMEEAKNRSSIQKEMQKTASELAQMESRLFDNEAVRRKVSKVIGMKLGGFAERFAN